MMVTNLQFGFERNQPQCCFFFIQFFLQPLVALLHSFPQTSKIQNQVAFVNSNKMWMFKMKPYIDDLSYLKDGRLALLARLHQSPRALRMSLSRMDFFYSV